MRRRVVPQRHVGQSVVLSRPADGSPLVLAPTAALVWHCLSSWVRFDDIDEELRELHPGISVEERRDTIRNILKQLADDDLLQH